MLIKELLQQKQMQNLGVSNKLDSNKLSLYIYGMNLTLVNQKEKCWSKEKWKELEKTQI